MMRHLTCTNVGSSEVPRTNPGCSDVDRDEVDGEEAGAESENLIGAGGSAGDSGSGRGTEMRGLLATLWKE